MTPEECGTGRAVCARTPAPGGAPTLITSVQRALRLLEAASSYPAGAPAKVLARAAAIPLPTAYHLLRTLVHEGYLRRENGVFVLGDAVGRLGPEAPSAPLQNRRSSPKSGTAAPKSGAADPETAAGPKAGPDPGPQAGSQTGPQTDPQAGSRTGAAPGPARTIAISLSPGRPQRLPPVIGRLRPGRADCPVRPVAPASRPASGHPVGPASISI
ncbi:helix-turn-helix domain-containing protein [Streptomyces sp. NPDC003691]